MPTVMEEMAGQLGDTSVLDSITGRRAVIHCPDINLMRWFDLVAFSCGQRLMYIPNYLFLAQPHPFAD